MSLLKTVNFIMKSGRFFTTTEVSTTKLKTMSKLKEELRDSMNIVIGSKVIPQDRAHLSQYLPSSQDQLPPRTMNDSYVAGIIPLSTDLILRDKYSYIGGTVRVGRLLEDMDMFSVIVAHKHILNPKLPKDKPFPQVLVTALVDKIEFTEYEASEEKDIKISGHVSWAGTSSMEIVVWLEQFNNNKWNRITRALFVIVARDPTNTKSTVVNPINPGNEREKKIHAGGIQRMKKRKVDEQSFFNTIPTVEEQMLIINIFKEKIRHTPGTSLKRRDLQKSRWMHDCILSTNIFSHSEDRNLHNSMFGGFIMRQAVEITNILAYRYAGQYTKLKNISDIRFLKPVPILSLPALYAFVVYTENQYIHIMCYMELFNPKTEASTVTNSFNFTYVSPEPVKDIIPVTYEEVMKYIDGRRHLYEDLKNEKLTK